MLFWLSVIEALDIRLCRYIDIMDNQLWIMQLSDLKSLTSLQGDDFLRMFNKCRIIMATSTFQWWIIILFWTFQVENYKYFRIFEKDSLFLHKFFVLWTSLLWRCSTFLKTKELVCEVAMILLGMSLWFAWWGQTSDFFLDCSFPSFQLPYKFPWALHKHGKRKFLHVLRFSNK